MYYTSLGKSYKNKSGKVLKVLEQIIEDADVARLKFDDGREGLYQFSTITQGHAILISINADDLEAGTSDVLVQV